MAVGLLLIGVVVGAVVGLVALLLVQRKRAAVAPDATAEAQPRRTLDLDLLQGALSSLGVGVVYVDDAGEVTIKNDLADHATGARHSDVLLDEVVEALLRRASRGRLGSKTVELFGPPRRVFLVEARPVASGGAIATILDISERSRIDSVRTDFVANISHELRTPIGALSLLAETLIDERDPEIVGRLSGKIVKEAGRLTRTVDDLLELARIELDGDSIREAVTVRRIVDDAIERVRGVAEMRNITVLVDCPVVDLDVVGDRRQLVSALGNLLSNEGKYSEIGQVITVSVAPHDHLVAFSVTDQGVGISQQHIDRIFERFYRVDRARSRETGGTGLGLSIVRHVATNHGGEVTVRSVEGEGSTFTLSVPSNGEVASGPDGVGVTR